MLSGFCVRKASLETAGNRGVNGLPACHSRAQNYGSVRVSSPAKSAVPGRKKNTLHDVYRCQWLHATELFRSRSVYSMPQWWNVYPEAQRFLFGSGSICDGITATSIEERWTVYFASSWFPANVAPNIARARHCGQICDSLLHVCFWLVLSIQIFIIFMSTNWSYVPMTTIFQGLAKKTLGSDRSLCCMVFYSRITSSGTGTRRADADSRTQPQGALGETAQEPGTLDLQRQFQREPRRDDHGGHGKHGKQTSELDIWEIFQPKPGLCDAARQSTEPDIWTSFQPEPWTSVPAKQSSQFDTWWSFQPKLGRNDPARQSWYLGIWQSF